MIFYPFYRIGFNKATVEFQKLKFLSNAFPPQNGLENRKVWSFFSNIPLDMPFDMFKQFRRDCNFWGQFSFISELLASNYEY